jgi:hypothetical protein
MAALRIRSSTSLGAAGLAQAAALVLMPKCPACAAVDFGVLVSFFAAVPLRAPQTVVFGLILSGAGALALGYRSRKRNGAPSAPGEPERAADGADCCAAVGIS